MTGDALSNMTGRWLRSAGKTLLSLPFAYAAMVILMLIAYFTRPALLSPMLLLLILPGRRPRSVSRCLGSPCACACCRSIFR